ncbi:MAG: type II secretion system protein [Ruminococcus sp.]|nr:type II secretion system protein [Ruminococcus sp.]
MKKKLHGFTLVELVVVITILTVLAGILIPSMIGFIVKAKVGSVNSNAKLLSNAAITALTELDTEDKMLPPGDYPWTKTLADNGETKVNPEPEEIMAAKIRKYFDRVDELESAVYRVSTVSVSAAAVQNGDYYGTYPNKTLNSQVDGTEGYAKDPRFDNSSERLLNWAQNASLS